MTIRTDNSIIAATMTQAAPSIHTQPLARIWHEHIELINLPNGWAWYHEPELPGMMWVEFGRYEGPTIVTDRDYMVNLHEAGHMANGHTQGRPENPPIDVYTEAVKNGANPQHYFDHGVLRSEAEAWEYALDNAIGVISEPTLRWCWSYCLGSYYRGYLSAIESGRQERGVNRLWNGNRHHVAFAYDTPDDYFWGIAKRLDPTATPA